MQPTLTRNLRRLDTHIGNWRESPHSQWSFQNVRSLLPTAEIRASVGARPINEAQDSSLDSLPTCVDKTHLPNWLQQSQVDSVVVLKNGTKVWQWCATHCDVEQPHIVFSVSKSISAMLTGILVADGTLDLTNSLTHYLPRLRGSAYSDCTLRHLLNMTVALDFDENYSEPTKQFLSYRAAVGWNPPDAAFDPVERLTLEPFICSLQKADHAHGERFSYKSPNTDLLGILLERATGSTLSSLLTALLWQPMGASRSGYITLDSAMTPRAAGGICITITDLARFGQLMLERGSVGTLSVVPENWVAETMAGGDKDAWQQGSFVSMLPQGSYCNKWYQVGNADQCMTAIGIHGQWLYLNPSSGVVIALLSSQSIPLDDARDVEMLSVLEQVSIAA